MRYAGVIPDNVLRMMSPADRASLGKAGMTAAEGQAKHDARLEKQIQDHIGQLLALRGIPFNRSRMDKPTTGTVGWPDFTFALSVPGRQYAVPVAVEVKRPGERPTPEQEACIARLKAGGWYVAVVHSEAEFLQLLATVQAG